MSARDARETPPTVDGQQADPLDWVRRIFSQGHFSRSFGMGIADIEPGFVRMRMVAGPPLLNGRNGPVNGGAIAAFLDSTAAAVVYSTRTPDDGLQQGTVDLNVTYLEPGREGELIAEGRVIRRGGTVVVVLVDVWDSAKQRIATGRCTFMLWPTRK